MPNKYFWKKQTDIRRPQCNSTHSSCLFHHAALLVSNYKLWVFKGDALPFSHETGSLQHCLVEDQELVEYIVWFIGMAFQWVHFFTKHLDGLDYHYLQSSSKWASRSERSNKKRRESARLLSIITRNDNTIFLESNFLVTNHCLLFLRMPPDKM